MRMNRFKIVESNFMLVIAFGFLLLFFLFGFPVRRFWILLCQWLLDYLEFLWVRIKKHYSNSNKFDKISALSVFFPPSHYYPLSFRWSCYCLWAEGEAPLRFVISRLSNLLPFSYILRFLFNFIWDRNRNLTFTRCVFFYRWC